MKITEETFTEAMEQAVAERGEDFVYPQEWKTDIGACQYWVRGVGPACIIGKALSILGTTAGELMENGNAADKIAQVSEVPLTLDFLNVPFARAAQQAQSAQDNGATWGEALDEYKTVLDSYKGERA